MRNSRALVAHRFAGGPAFFKSRFHDFYGPQSLCCGFRPELLCSPSMVDRCFALLVKSRAGHPVSPCVSLVGRYLALAPAFSFSRTWSTLKLPAFWLGGKSLNVARNSPTMACA